MKRNFGVDIAWIMSMFMVVVIHNLNQGGVLRNTTSVTGFLSSYELFNLSIVAVNVFALITGYVYSGKGIKLKRVVGLYLEVLFLSVFSLVIYTLFFGLPKNVDTIKSMFPLLTGVYWYYNAYVGFVLIEPILRIGVNSLTRNNLLRILVVMLLFAGSVGFTVYFSIIWAFAWRLGSFWIFRIYFYWRNPILSCISYFSFHSTL